MTTAGTASQAPGHGTYAGYHKHLKAGTDPCGPCRGAAARYMRHYRRDNPQAREHDRWWGATRAAALDQLVSEYPKRFLEILYEIREGTAKP